MASREGRALSRSIIGTADPRQVSERLDAFCASWLGAGVEEAFLCELSVGAAFGLRLRDGRRVFFKAHPPGQSRGFLEAVYRVQRRLCERDFPSPAPISGPLPFGRGFATVEEFVDEGERADAHEPEVRRCMAGMYVRAIRLAGTVSDVRALSRAWKLPPGRGLWPVPHNVLFDFEATTEDAGWIDDIARKAKKVLDDAPGRMVVGHADWSVKHFRFKDGEVGVIYDWDSLRLDRETSLVGHAATHFPYTEHFDVPRRASPEEARLFVEEYEIARAAPFSEWERVAVRAAAVYGLAYTARCEHAVDPADKDLPGSFREALSSCAEEYLRL